MKKILIGIILFAALLLLALFAVCVYFINYAIVRPDYDKTKDYAKNAKMIYESADGPLSEQMAVIESDDGLTLSARVIKAERESRKWLIVIHGYHSDKGMCANVTYQFRSRGFNVLQPDLRSHGESEGKYIGMGWLERLDVLKWIDEVIKYDPEAEIILHGTSMGGATVMMLAGEKLPEQVKGIIEDCGFTSVWDMFEGELKKRYNLPAFPIMHVSSVFAKAVAGYSFREASSVEQLKKADKPILFIHGSQDDLVDVSMVHRVYEACASQKEILIVEGAGHADSHRKNPELYYDAVFSFIERYCITEG